MTISNNEIEMAGRERTHQLMSPNDEQSFSSASNLLVITPEAKVKAAKWWTVQLMNSLYVGACNTGAKLVAITRKANVRSIRELHDNAPEAFKQNFNVASENVDEAIALNDLDMALGRIVPWNFEQLNDFLTLGIDEYCNKKRITDSGQRKAAQDILEALGGFYSTLCDRLMQRENNGFPIVLYNDYEPQGLMGDDDDLRVAYFEYCERIEPYSSMFYHLPSKTRMVLQLDGSITMSQNGVDLDLTPLVSVPG
jgi:hypothetical protein